MADSSVKDMSIEPLVGIKHLEAGLYSPKESQHLVKRLARLARLLIHRVRECDFECPLANQLELISWRGIL